MIWLQPLAWWGLLAALVPIVIHLIARPRSRRVPFPSLRFLRSNDSVTLNSFRPTDWPLLLVRVLTLATATAAFAGPLLVSEGRRISWERRTARALVLHGVDGDTAASLIDAETERTFTHARFSAATVADAVREAVAWLERQPPALREMVLVGDFRHGDVTQQDFAHVPPSIGLRFLPVDVTSRDEVGERLTMAEGPGGVRQRTLRVVATADETRATYTDRGAPARPAVHIVVPSEHQAHADAMLAAIMRDGIVRREDDRRITLMLGGSGEPPVITRSSPRWMRQVLEANPDVRGGDQDGVLVVHVPTPVSDPRAVDTVARIVRSAFGVLVDAPEPRRVPAAALAAWSRPPSGIPPDAPYADEGDRRWFWAAVIALLVLESVMRRQRAQDRSSAVVAQAQGDTRVA